MTQLPYIGWKACEERFFLDALPITTQQAIEYYKQGTAMFGPHAAKRVRTLLLGSNIAWHIEQTQRQQQGD
jgi:hypothetical protein